MPAAEAVRWSKKLALRHDGPVLSLACITVTECSPASVAVLTGQEGLSQRTAGTKSPQSGALPPQASTLMADSARPSAASWHAAALCLLPADIPFTQASQHIQQLS